MAKKVSVSKKANTPVKDTAAVKKSAPEDALPGETLTNDKPFMIVGIGASAGGVEAVSSFVKALPENLRMAYVVVQHLSPDHESILPEILQRLTTMPVHQVEDGQHILPDNIYVIPPNNYMSIIDGHLRLGPRGPGNIAPHTIDFFLTGLAAHYQNKAIGIILSGMAPDGAAGIQTIKAEGGITFAQDDTAEFPGMPMHVISTGYVDFVLPPEAIASELASIAKLPYALASPEQILKSGEAELRKIHILLHNKVGVDFSVYKQTTINRRILRRMGLTRQASIGDYIRYLMKNPEELELLYKDLLINVTFFFREPGQYKALYKTILPALFRNRKTNDPLRIWIPACSTGEEACSFAISLFEYLGETAMTTPVQIFATDLSEAAIEKARTGIYAKTALEGVSPERIKRFFVKIDGSYQIIKAIRDICIYATHNLLQDPPFSRMDIISCQNVMIYLEAGPQQRILNAFHYALKPTGFLMLGKSETIGTAIDLFEQIEKDPRIYTKKTTRQPAPMDFPARMSAISQIREGHTDDHFAAKPEVSIDIEKEADKLLLSRYVPASVVVNKDLHIIRFNGNTSHYLHPASGKASLHLLKMVRDELVFEIRSLIYRVKKEARPAKKEGIEIYDEGVLRTVNLEVVPLKSAKEMFYLVLFRELLFSEQQIAASLPERSEDAKNKRIRTLEEDLRQVRTEMKHMSEEFEATREELQSANEEVLSSNEELQSINEELETSKEELQSTNEELITINEELQHRNNDLREAVEYTEAIVQTIREPLLVLNFDLRVRAANQAFYHTFQVKSVDIEGNYFFEVAKGLFNLPELKAMLDEVITLDRSFYNKELSSIVPSSGEKVLMFSAMRLNMEDQKNNRILLSIEDVTQRKKAEETLKESEERFRLLVQNAFDIITIFSKDGTIQYQSESIEAVLGYRPAERIGRNAFNDPIVHPEDVHIKEKMFQECIAMPLKNITAEFRMQHKKGDYRTLEAVCINMLDHPRIHGIIANYRDVTERRVLERQKDEFLGIASHELKTPVTSIKGYSEILIETFEEQNDKYAVELVRKMDSQVDRLTNLIRDLLDVTRITEGQLKLREVFFDINDLVPVVVEEMQRTTDKHQIISSLKPAGKLWADRERIGQVLTNLISNAIKYSPKGGKIRVSTQMDKDQLTVSVKDDGIGVDKYVKDKIFDRFSRLSEGTNNTYPGLGLGLYIAKEIIKRHNGTIDVESTKGNGTRFYFTLRTGNR